VELGYSSGAPPPELVQGGTAQENDMQQDLAGLALFPRMSLANGQFRTQRSDNMEASYHKTAKSRTYSAGGFQERVRDASVAMAGALDLLDPTELLPDIASASSMFNLGNYTAYGFLAGVTQAFGENWSAAVAYGEGSALAPLEASALIQDAGSLRANFHPVLQQWASARVAGLIPGSGTRFTVTYVWTPPGTLGPVHAWLTESFQPALGLNLHVRQPLPSLGMPGRLEATADLRNLTSRGYLPMATADNRQLLLVQFPKSIRGGLSFIF